MKAVIEIPKGSKYKYEVCKTTGVLVLDRVLHIPVPQNYGYIPFTLSEDGDPLDVFLISDEPIPPLTEVNIQVLGLIECVDTGQNDEKIIAVIENDKPCENIISASYYILSYLSNYKGDKILISNFNSTFDDAIAANKVIKKCEERYKKT